MAASKLSNSHFDKKEKRDRRLNLNKTIKTWQESLPHGPVATGLRRQSSLINTCVTACLDADTSIEGSTSSLKKKKQKIN